MKSPWKRKMKGGEKKLFSFFFFDSPQFYSSPTQHTHTHIRGRHSLDEKNTKTPPWPVTWHQLPSNQQPTGLSWQPIKDLHSHAEQRHITMATLTHTLWHTHTHTNLPCSLSPFLRLAPPLLSALQRCSPGTVCVSCSNDCKCFQCATLSCCKEPFKECTMGSSSAPLKSYYTSLIFASLSPFVSVQ